jgi:hypothetical protein
VFDGGGTAAVCVLGFNFSGVAGLLQGLAGVDVAVGGGLQMLPGFGWQMFPGPDFGWQMLGGAPGIGMYIGGRLGGANVVMIPGGTGLFIGGSGGGPKPPVGLAGLLSGGGPSPAVLVPGLPSVGGPRPPVSPGPAGEVTPPGALGSDAFGPGALPGVLPGAPGSVAAVFGVSFGLPPMPGGVLALFGSVPGAFALPFWLPPGP